MVRNTLLVSSAYYSLAEAGGTATVCTLTKDGERRQAEPMVEYAQALYQHCRQRRIGFLAYIATHVPHVMRSEPSSSCLRARISSGFSARGAELGREQDASKEGGESSGKHLAKSWKVARSASEASPAFFFQGSVLSTVYKGVLLMYVD